MTGLLKAINVTSQFFANTCTLIKYILMSTVGEEREPKKDIYKSQVNSYLLKISEYFCITKYEALFVIPCKLLRQSKQCKLGPCIIYSTVKYLKL